MQNDLLKTKQKINHLLKSSGVLKAAVFGSVARGQAGKNSDIDILVKLAASKTLLDFVGLKLDLEKKLGKKVDLVEYCSIHPRLKKQILSEQVPIYEKRQPTFS